MKKYRSFCILLLMFVPLLGQAHKKTFSQYKVGPGLKHLLKTDHHVNKNTNLAVIVESLKTGRILYQRHAAHLFEPASVQKLFTASAALAYLKPSYHFTTELLTRGEIRGHELAGNLTIKFTGDPELTKKELAQLIGQLKAKGVKRITGRVYIDNDDYNTIPYPPGWIWDDLSYDYAAPLNAIIINRNQFNLKFIPAKTLNKPPKLKTDLPRGVAYFNNYMLTTHRYYAHCPIAIYSDDRNVYTLHGCLDKRWGTQSRALAIRDVDSYAKTLIRLMLRENHIQFHGQIKMHHTPKNSSLIAQHLSPPLSKIIYEMLKNSDNLTTDSLLKKIGEVYYRRQGSWQNGLRALKRLLAKPTGIDFTKMLLNDGAGLSRYNLLEPQQVMKILRYAYFNHIIRPAFLAALPIAGKDGTLEDRMLSEGRSERIHAKTGSMTGVSSLAGYILTKHNGTLAFVIMINNFVGPRAPYIHLENHICTFLVNARRSTHG